MEISKFHEVVSSPYGLRSSCENNDYSSEKVSNLEMTKFASIAWALWQRRNSFLVTHDEELPDIVFRRATDFLQEYQQANPRSHSSLTHPIIQDHIHPQLIQLYKPGDLLLHMTCSKLILMEQCLRNKILHELGLLLKITMVPSWPRSLRRLRLILLQYKSWRLEQQMKQLNWLFISIWTV